VDIAAFSSETLMAILPEILLLMLAGLILLYDMVFKRSRPAVMGGISTIGFLAILVVAILFSRPETGDTLILGGMLRHDWPAFTFKIVLLFAAAVSALLSTGLREVSDRGEYFALLIVATLGMNLMAASADLMMLFLAIETTSIPLYILAGFVKGDDKSTESGIKYFLFGALTSAVMLYGFSLLYGFTGDTNLYSLAVAMRAGSLSRSLRSRSISGHRMFTKEPQRRSQHLFRRRQKPLVLQCLSALCWRCSRRLNSSGPGSWL
jgi:NADH-quinone oxidoreductase subunit N